MVLNKYVFSSLSLSFLKNQIFDRKKKEGHKNIVCQ